MFSWNFLVMSVNQMSLFCSDGRTGPSASKILGIQLISVLKCLKLTQTPLMWLKIYLAVRYNAALRPEKKGNGPEREEVPR